MAKKKYPQCEKIIRKLKHANKTRPKNKKINPYAIANATPKCRKEKGLPSRFVSLGAGDVTIDVKRYH